MPSMLAEPEQKQVTGCASYSCRAVCTHLCQTAIANISHSSVSARIRVLCTIPHSSDDKLFWAVSAAAHLCLVILLNIASFNTLLKRLDIGVEVYWYDST